MAAADPPDDACDREEYEKALATALARLLVGEYHRRCQAAAEAARQADDVDDPRDAA